MINIFDVIEEISFLQQQYLEAESPEEEQLILDTLDSKGYELEELVENKVKMIKNIEGQSVAIKNEAKAMAEKAKKLEKKAQNMKLSLHNLMMRVGKRKVNGELFTVSIQKNPPSLKIVNEDTIPESYYEIPTPQIDTTKLKNALKNGETVPGVELVQGESVRIK